MQDLSGVTSIEELEKLLYSKDDNKDDNNEENTEDGVKNDGSQLDAGDPSPTESRTDSESLTETQDEQENPEPSEDEFLVKLKSMQPDDLLRLHPGLQGKYGAEIDRRSRELAAKKLDEERQRQAQILEEAEENALIELAETDPEAAAREIANRAKTKKVQKDELKRQEEINTRYGSLLHTEMEEIYKTPLMDELAKEMTDEQLVALYWKNGQYNGFADWSEGFARTLLEYGKEKGRQEAKAELEKSRTPQQKPIQPKSESRGIAFKPSANLDTEPEEVNEYQPGDIDKMDWRSYAQNRERILKSIR